MSVTEILALLKDSEVKFVDLRFTDLLGKEHHLTVPASQINEDFLQQDGKMFDGSSLTGWKSVNESDMVLLPDLTTAVIDPFFEDTTLAMRCHVFDPIKKCIYNRDPRAIAQKAENYLKETGIADTVYFGSEPEFFLFDDVRFGSSISSSFVFIDDVEGTWNSGTKYENGNKGHRPAMKGGYVPLPPVDSSHDIRSKMCLLMEQLGLVVEAHHHEVATGQNEIACRFNTLTYKADETQIYKYVVQNVANIFNKTATFMPKPIEKDNGSGMHCHQSLAKNGENLFVGDKYAGLSQLALYYIGGIIKHAKALNAFTNPTTNSYKRLVPGFEAPVTLAYSAQNRSASIRVPIVNTSKAKRIEVRFPDPAANPYLAFASQLMAGIDGIINKIDPGEAIDKNLYDLSNDEKAKLQSVAYSLDEALSALDEDRAFLTQNEVFTDDMIDAYIAIKKAEIARLYKTPHPLEFELYYNC